LRLSLDIKKFDTKLAESIMSKDKCMKLDFQRRIDKIQDEVGIEVLGCNCKKCSMIRFALNNIFILVMSLQIEGLDYEEERKSY